MNFLTNEWVDGILAKFVKQSINEKSEDKFWFIFDGPVDP